MNLILEFDDLHWKDPENCLSTITNLINKFNNIKLNFFTVANHSNIPISKNKEWCDRIRTYIESGNIQLVVHGNTHSFKEFEITNKKIIKEKLLSVENEFKNANLEYIKIFKGPNWGITTEVIEVLKELEYISVFLHTDYKHLEHNMKSIYYNWNLMDDKPPIASTLIAHGHTWNACNNGISQTYNKIVDFIIKNNPTFQFLGQL